MNCPELEPRKGTSRYVARIYGGILPKRIKLPGAEWRSVGTTTKKRTRRFAGLRLMLSHRTASICYLRSRSSSCRTISTSPEGCTTTVRFSGGFTTTVFVLPQAASTSGNNSIAGFNRMAISSLSCGENSRLGPFVPQCGWRFFVRATGKPMQISACLLWSLLLRRMYSLTT